MLLWFWLVTALIYIPYNSSIMGARIDHKLIEVHFLEGRTLLSCHEPGQLWILKIPVHAANILTISIVIFAYANQAVRAQNIDSVL